MKIARIAFRNISRQKKRTFLLGGAIAFGVMIIVVINSFSAGINVNVKYNFTSLLGGHIYISGQETTDTGRVISVIGDRTALEQALAPVRDRIERVQYRSRAFGELIFVSKQATVTLDGVNWDMERELIERLQLTAGDKAEIPKKQSIVVPETTAKELGVEAGETVLLRLSSVTGQQNVGEFTVAAISKDQGSFGIASAYTDIAYLNSLLSLKPEEYQNYNITLSSMSDINIVAALIKNDLKKSGKLYEDDADSPEGRRSGGMGMMFGGRPRQDTPWEGTRFTVTTLNDIMEPLNNLTVILNGISWGLFLVFMLITVVGLLNTFRMVLLERTREIGTMRAIGMHRKQVRNMFLLEALFLGLGGAAAGLIIAFVIMVIFGAIPFAGNQGLQFFLRDYHFAFPLVPGRIILTLALLIGMTLLAASVPARKAAKLKPADALRATY